MPRTSEQVLLNEKIYNYLHLEKDKTAELSAQIKAWFTSPCCSGVRVPSASSWIRIPALPSSLAKSTHWRDASDMGAVDPAWACARPGRAAATGA